MGDTEWSSDCGKAQLILGDCLERLRELPDCSVDSVVTDPPYGLAFMGKKWDYDVPAVEVWAECLRVLKPGGHLLAFAGTRTQHRMAVRIEDAGFEIRDMIAWVYGSGFPKSHDVSKAIDKAAGAEREVVPASGGLHKNANLNDDGWSKIGSDFATMWSNNPATEAARQWQGWGTALKPSLEPITVARKPLTGTVAENVLQHGTGAINVDGCRVGFQGEADKAAAAAAAQRSCQDQNKNRTAYGQFNNGAASLEPYLNGLDKGRWPANLIHDGSDEVVELFPNTKSGNLNQSSVKAADRIYGGGFGNGKTNPRFFQANEGSAARFFYCAKASKADREAGCEGLEFRTAGEMVDREEGSAGIQNPRAGAGRTGGGRNGHPTVKPCALMRYLCRLVTPPGGIVLDPFMGSGSTGKGAILEGFRFIGIEREAEYLEIAKARIAHAIANYEPPKDKPAQLSLLPDQH